MIRPYRCAVSRANQEFHETFRYRLLAMYSKRVYVCYNLLLCQMLILLYNYIPGSLVQTRFSTVKIKTFPAFSCLLSWKIGCLLLMVDCLVCFSFLLRNRCIIQQLPMVLCSRSEGNERRHTLLYPKERNTTYTNFHLLHPVKSIAFGRMPCLHVPNPDAPWPTRLRDGVRGQEDPKTTKLPQVSCVVISAKVVMGRHPQHFKLGVMNNADAEIATIELDPREPYLRNKRRGYHIVQLQFPPTRVFVHIAAADKADGSPAASGHLLRSA